MINFNAFTPSRFSCSPVIRECLWMKTQIEKKKQIHLLLVFEIYF